MKIVLLAIDCDSTRSIYHALTDHFDDPVEVFFEQPIPRLTTLRRRRQRLGTLTVLGQILFMGLVVPWLRRRSQARIDQLCESYRLSREPIPDPIQVDSVNLASSQEKLRRSQPGVILINGTRIISRSTLASVHAPFINTHAGINPGYRGCHGGYWALLEGHPEWAGTTVHLVDEGIDTGKVLYQEVFRPGPEDNFVTYPYHHTGIGIPLLIQAVEDVFNNQLHQVDPPPMPSRLRYHPTLWNYLWGWFRRGIR